MTSTPITLVLTTPDLEFQYPAAGDPPPPGGADVHLLTEGETCIRGKWSNDPDRGLLGWAPMPKRNAAKQAIALAALQEARQ